MSGCQRLAANLRCVANINLQSFVISCSFVFLRLHRGVENVTPLMRQPADRSRFHYVYRKKAPITTIRETSLYRYGTREMRPTLSPPSGACGFALDRQPN